MWVSGGELSKEGLIAVAKVEKSLPSTQGPSRVISPPPLQRHTRTSTWIGRGQGVEDTFDVTL